MINRNTSTVLITDIAISLSSASNTNPSLDGNNWQRIEKELYLHTTPGKSAWLLVARQTEDELGPSSLVVTDISVGNPPSSAASSEAWERRAGGLWVQRKPYARNIRHAFTDIDILFGTDAVDPRPHWTLTQGSLQLPDAPSPTPIARLTTRRGDPPPNCERPNLRAREDGTFKIVQVSDTHMVTGVGSCNDAIDADGNPLPTSEADPLTTKFLGEILDSEKPDLVVFTGDQLHHDIPDSQTTLFKIVAPVIERGIPWAAVFGNHDSEGEYALSRSDQMALYQSLPFSLCSPGPENVYGIGNYHLPVLTCNPSSSTPIATLYFLDSHGQINADTQNSDYEAIQPSQIRWFEETSQALRKERESNCTATRQTNCAQYEKDKHTSLVFFHIPLPEFAKDSSLARMGGQRHEPTEGPQINTHFYTALAREGVAAVGCGHDHVNDFCARVKDESGMPQGPWLCYNGGTGFGGYCSYGTERYYRRTRVWEIDTGKGTLRTWKRREYLKERMDEVELVGDGVGDVRK